MHRFVILVTAIFALALSKSTIDDTMKLFTNTVKRWNVQIRDKRDHSERYNRLLRMKRSVDETTSGVMLDSLNRFAINNDEEHEALMSHVRRAANMTLSLNLRSADDDHKLVMMEKRDYPEPEEADWDNLPEEYQYWEKDLGMSDPQDQTSCGSCWSFPTAAAMEALYRKLTGEFVVFSKQYFIDCTFDYSGCAGGAVNDGFKLTKDRQYVMSEEDWPLTSDYQECKFWGWIYENKNNAMRKAWFQDWYPLGKGEDALIGGLRHSPVAFGGYISYNYFAYSSGPYEDSLCGIDPLPHAQLLVGYTKDTLRVRGSYGKHWGDNGFINYKRGSPTMDACRLFDSTFAIIMTHRRQMQYELCNGGKPTTRQVCRESCLGMNKAGENGWELAVIPTVYHNNEIVKMVNAKWPGVKSDDKFNLLWIGLSDPDKCSHFHWSERCYQVNYFNYTRSTGTGKYGLLNKNNGGWEMKSSLTYQARGVCGRARTCYDISTKIEHGDVTFSTDDPDNLVEGTTADITCEKDCKINGAKQVTCVGGHWGEPGDDHDDHDEHGHDEDEHLPTCVCPEDHDHDGDGKEEEKKGKKDKKDKKNKKDKKGKKDKKKKKNGMA